MIDFEKIVKDQSLISESTLFQLIPLCAIGALAACHMAGMVFLGYNQDHLCTMPRQEEILETCNITWSEQETSHYIPWNSKTQSLDSCTRYVYDSINCTFWGVNRTLTQTNKSLVRTEQCNSWTYDTSVFTTTVLGDFDLVCDSKQKGRLSQAIFMFGVTIGVSFWGQFSDKFGRKKGAITTLVIGLGVAIATAFSSSFTVFAILRFFIGFTIMPASSCSYVLGMELVKGDKKVIVSQLFGIVFSVGFSILSAVGYLVRDWRRLQIWISAPGIILIIWMGLTIESPRWLISTGQYKKAGKTIKKLLSSKEYEENAEAQKLRSFSKAENAIDGKEVAGLKESETNVEMIQNKVNKQTVVDILKLPNMRKKSFILYYMWMVASSLYYGLTLNSADLGGNAFVNLLISAVAEIPAALLAIPLMDIWGRQPTLTVSLIISGIVCICVMFVSKEIVWLSVILSTIGKFSITIAFGTVYVYAVEIYPTPVRNVGIGVCNSWARIGGMLAPFIAMLDVIGFAVPYVTFGLMAVLAGILAYLLPETLGKRCPETLKEAEQFGNQYEGIKSVFCNNSIKKNNTVDEEIMA